MIGQLYDGRTRQRLSDKLVPASRTAHQPSTLTDDAELREVHRLCRGPRPRRLADQPVQNLQARLAELAPDVVDRTGRIRPLVLTQAVQPAEVAAVRHPLQHHRDAGAETFLARGVRADASFHRTGMLRFAAQPLPDLHVQGVLPPEVVVGAGSEYVQ